MNCFTVVMLLIKNQFKRVTWTTVILLLVVLVVPLVAGQNEAATAIATAKQQIVTCYQAAAGAETAGANITSLTSILNEAGMLLSNAELAYSKGDFNAARDQAVQSQTRLSNFVSEANALSEIAGQQRNLDFIINVVGSTVGTLVILGAAVAVWFFLKKRFVTRGEEQLAWRPA